MKRRLAVSLVYYLMQLEKVLIVHHMLSVQTPEHLASWRLYRVFESAGMAPSLED